MRRLSAIICSMLLCVSVGAQTNREVPAGTNAGTADDVYLQNNNAYTGDRNGIFTGDEVTVKHLTAEDTVAATAAPLSLPPLNRYGGMRLCSYPTDFLGLYDWDLHKGLNVNLGLSVFATFGKHAPKGAGFSQNIAAMYAVPLTGRLSLAVGGYFNNISWTGHIYRDAGFNAMLGYRFNERWEAYLYGQKSVTNNRIPMPLYDMGDMGDRIGAAVRYNVSPSFSIQMSVSRSEDRGPYLSDFMRDVMCR